MLTKNKAATADGEVLRNIVDGDELRAYIERIERLNEEKKVVSADISELYKEIKAAGYDAPTIRAIVKRRAMDASKRSAMDDLLELYVASLGDFALTPLGEAGADRIRSGAHV